MRRARALIAGLPPGALNDRTDVGYGAEWSLVVEMLASLIEVVDATSWRSVMPHVGKNWKPPKPLKIPRPGHRPEQPAVTRGIPMDKFRQIVGAKRVTYVPRKDGD